MPWKSCTGNLFGTPTKLLEYMAVARPVVASDLPFVRNLIKGNECGLVVPWDSPSAHAEALLHLFAHDAEARTLGESGRRAILDELNWERQAASLVELYAACLSRKAESN